MFDGQLALLVVLVLAAVIASVWGTYIGMQNNRAADETLQWIREQKQKLPPPVDDFAEPPENE
jgi:hypothetical protein